MTVPTFRVALLFLVFFLPVHVLAADDEKKPTEEEPADDPFGDIDKKGLLLPTPTRMQRRILAKSCLD